MTQYSELIERLRQARALNEYGFIEVHREFLDEAATALSGLVADSARTGWCRSMLKCERLWSTAHGRTSWPSNSATRRTRFIAPTFASRLTAPSVL